MSEKSRQYALLYQQYKKANPNSEPKTSNSEEAFELCLKELETKLIPTLKEARKTLNRVHHEIKLEVFLDKKPNGTC